MNSRRILLMSEIAILVAIILVLGLTPIGYMRLPFLPMIEITLITVPVIIGGIAMGPLAGAILGGLFGLTSFIQCFGMSFFGAALLAVNPFFTFCLCFFPRLIMGWLTAIIFRAFKKKNMVSFLVTSLSGAVLNTVLFTALLLVLFSNAPIITDMRGGMNVLAFAVAFVGINGLIEAVVCALLGTFVGKAVYKVNLRSYVS